MVIEIKNIWDIYALCGHSFFPILFLIMVGLSMFMAWMDDLLQKL